MQLPFAANPIGSPFVELQSVDSTNKHAMTLVHEGMAQHGMVVYSHEQTAGKGQRGKVWQSEKDENIVLSLIINPNPLTVIDQFKLSICSALAIHEFFSHYAGDETKLKWPNDLYWRDRKAGGVLIENVIQSGQSAISNWQWAIIGIGINVNQTKFHQDLPNPVSLKQITGKEFSPLELAKELCRIFDNYFQLLSARKFEQLFENYQTHLYKKDQIVKLKKDSRVFEATIKGVSKTGQLITQHAIEERFDFGSIEWMI